MSSVGLVALTAAVLLGTMACLTVMVVFLSRQIGVTVTKAVNDVLNPPAPDEPQGKEPVSQPDQMTDGLIRGEEDYLPEWEREFEDTTW